MKPSICPLVASKLHCSHLSPAEAMKPLKPLASWLGIVLLLLVPASAYAQSETPRAPLATFDYDAEAPLDIREVGTEDRGRYTVVDFTFASPAGGRVPALLYEPKGEGPFAGLILMHGMPGSRKNSSRSRTPSATTPPAASPNASSGTAPATASTRRLFAIRPCGSKSGLASTPRRGGLDHRTRKMARS